MEKIYLYMAGARTKGLNVGVEGVQSKKTVLWLVLFVIFVYLSTQGIFMGQYNVVRAFVRILCPSCVGLQ
jgi:hypothetical protein